MTRHMGRVAVLDVLLIEPEQFLRIECGRSPVDVADVEQLDHLVDAEDLLIAVRPAEPHQIVEQGLGQIAVLPVLHDADRAVALGEPLAVRAQNHGHVGILRRLPAQRLHDVDLTRRVVEVVVAANHVRDPHVVIVHDHGQVVGGGTVAAGDDEIVELPVVEHHLSAHQILDHHLALLRIAETDHEGRVRRGRLGTGAAMPVVARLLLARHLRLAQRLEPFLRAIAAIGMAALEQRLDHLPIAIEPVRLIEGAFVVFEAQPGHALENGVDRLRGGTFEIGVLDAQHETPPVPARMKPGKECGSGAPDVQVARGTRSETGLDHASTASVREAGIVPEGQGVFSPASRVSEGRACRRRSGPGRLRWHARRCG